MQPRDGAKRAKHARARQSHRARAKLRHADYGDAKEQCARPSRDGREPDRGAVLAAEGEEPDQRSREGADMDGLEAQIDRTGHGAERDDQSQCGPRRPNHPGLQAKPKRARRRDRRQHRAGYKPRQESLHQPCRCCECQCA